MGAVLYSWVGAGLKIAIIKMTKKSKDNMALKNKLEQMASLLKFVLTLDDEEIVKSTIESVIELLEEEINK